MLRLKQWLDIDEQLGKKSNSKIWTEGSILQKETFSKELQINRYSKNTQIQILNLCQIEFTKSGIFLSHDKLRVSKNPWI